MGPKRIHPNYRNDVLLTIIAEVLPVGAQMWEDVASQYQIAAGENEKRDADVIKRHFNDKLCNGNKKPTGNSGDARYDLILQAQRIKLKILQNQAVGNVGSAARNTSADEDSFGFDNENDEDPEDNDEEELLVEGNNDLYGNEFRPTQVQAEAALQGGTSFGIVPNGPPVATNAPKRQMHEAIVNNKTKSMKQSPRQTAGNHIAALGTTLQTVAESSTSAMMFQMMMQQQQQMQQQMQQQGQQNMQMMMMMMGMMRSSSPMQPPQDLNAQAFASPLNRQTSSPNEN